MKDSVSYVVIENAQNVQIGDVYYGANQCPTGPVEAPYPERPPESRQYPEIRNNRLRKKLKAIYRDITLPCIHLMAQEKSFDIKQYYIDLEMSTDGEEVDQDIKPKQIFDKRNEKSPKRILVEGQPGFGKTTLATKLIFDWAHECEYLKHFELVFFIPLRHLRENSLEEAMASICKNCDCHEVLDLNEERQKKILLVLDGFDEICNELKEDILKVLFKSVFSSMTVLVTCRTGVFPLKTEELQKLYPQFPCRKTAFYDRKITVKGIGVQNRLRFLQQFCQDCGPEEVLNKYSVLTNRTCITFRSPLLLLLIGNFIVQFNELNIKSTRTNFYKSLFSNLVKCNLAKVGKLVDQRFDLYDIENESSIVQQDILEKFGDLCLDQLIKRNYTFAKDEFASEVYQLGLLSKHKSISTFNTNEYFECFHLTFMEFAAAYSLWRKIQIKWKRPEVNLITMLWSLIFKDGTCEMKDSFQKLKILIEQSHETCLVHVFLSGLLQKDSSDLFQQLLTAGLDFRQKDFCFWKMVAELDEDIELSKTIGKFVYWNDFYNRRSDSSLDDLDDFFLSKFHSDIMEQVLERLSIVSLQLPRHLFCRVPAAVTINRLYVQLPDDETRTECVRYTENVRCNHLIYELKCNPNEVDFDLKLQENLTTYCSIEAAKKKELQIQNGGSNSSLLDHFKFGFLKDVNFNSVEVKSLSESNIDIICLLLERNRVYELDFGITEDTIDSDYQRVLSSVMCSNSLYQLRVYNWRSQPVAIDLHRFLDKFWEHLQFDNCNLYCKSVMTDVSCSKCKEIIDAFKHDILYAFSNSMFTNVKTQWRKQTPQMLLKFK